MDGIPIALFGDTGRVGRHISRVLENHDKVSVAYRQNSTRTEGTIDGCVLAFLATEDKESMEFAPMLLSKGIRVIDASGAFRITKEDFEKWYKLRHTCPELIEEAVYGIPAYFREDIANARLVANPGCYPTSVILALRPLRDLLQGTAFIKATSGNSGAEDKVEGESNEITYSYGTKHKHVPEMKRYSGFFLRFTPVVLKNVYAGINANIDVELSDELKNLPGEDAVEKLEQKIISAYGPEDLVFVVRDPKEIIKDERGRDKQVKWGTREVVNTHRCIIKVMGVDEGFVSICSMLDNLGKGAASQAVENMNLMLGLPRLYGIHPVYSTEPLILK